MQRTSLLVGALLVQVTIVGVMLVKAVMPLWTGQEVVIAATAVDPRDLMRGDYVELSYEIGSVRLRQVNTDIDPDERLRYGQQVYVAITATDSGVVATGLYREKPEGTLFLKGRRNYISGDSGHVQVSYGIEEYYTDPETAQRLDKTLRSGGKVNVHVMVDSDGNARIRAIDGK